MVLDDLANELAVRKKRNHVHEFIVYKVDINPLVITPGLNAGETAYTAELRLECGRCGEIATASPHGTRHRTTKHELIIEK